MDRSDDTTDIQTRPLAAVPLVEEQVEITTRETVGDVVRIEIRTEPEAELVRATLSSQTAKVERHPVGDVIESIPDIRREGNTTIVPVVEERLVTRTELVLVEEIHITQTTARRDVEETVLLRRQVPEITRQSASKGTKDV